MTGCVNGVGCVGYDRATNTSGLADRCPLCWSCVYAAEHDIRALSLDYRDLEQMLPPGANPVSAWVTGSDTPAVPLDLGVDTLQRDIAWTLAVWEPVVREVAHLVPERTRGVRPGWAVATAVGVIAPRVELLANVPLTWGLADGLDAGWVERDGTYAVASLRVLHRRALAALGLSRHVVRLPGACTRCGATALERDADAETVCCGHCGCRWAAEEYRRYVGLALGGARAAGTL